MVSCAQSNDGTTDQLSRDVTRIAKSLAKEDMYMSSAVGFAGTQPEQWDRYLELKNTATEAELEILTNHTNPAVRCYAFQALAERGGKQTFTILLQHLKDTVQVRTLQGCIGSSEQVGDFFLDMASPPYIPDQKFELTNEQKQVIDSILLFDDGITLQTKSRLIANLEPKENFYNRFRTIYLQERSSASLIALSKFGRADDKPFIIDWLTRKDTHDQYKGLRAVRNFLDPDFYPYLVKIHEQEIKKPTGFNYSLIRMLYFDLAQYKTPETLELFEKTLATKGSTFKYHSEYLWLALTKYPDPMFSELLNRIELTDFQKENVNYWMEGQDN